MNVQATIKKDLKEALKDDDARFNHVMRVIDTVQALSDLHGGNKEKLTIAALLHDMTKNQPNDWHIKTIRPVFGQGVIDAFPPPLYHAFSAMIVARETYGIEDLDILLPIKHHTIGKPAMSLHEKLLFLADYTEPGRPFDSAKSVGKTAQRDLNQAVFEAMDAAIRVFESGGEVPALAYKSHRYYEILTHPPRRNYE